jgi:RNA polymerase sigma-70 factor (ECF subfamily)
MIGIEKEDFAEVVRHHRLPIFRFILASVRDTGLAEDLTQDCFWRAYQGWHRFRGDCGVHTWLRHIASNIIRNSVRSKKFEFCRTASLIDPRVEDCMIEDVSPSPETQVIRRNAVCAVWRAAAVLSPKQQLALQLRFAEDMDVPEIATAMDVSEGTVKAHLYRAVQSVRIALRVSPCAVHRS